MGESKKGHCVEIEQQVKCASCDRRLGVKDLTDSKVSHSKSWNDGKVGVRREGRSYPDLTHTHDPTRRGIRNEQWKRNILGPDHLEHPASSVARSDLGTSIGLYWAIDMFVAD